MIAIEQEDSVTHNLSNLAFGCIVLHFFYFSIPRTQSELGYILALDKGGKVPLTPDAFYWMGQKNSSHEWEDKALGWRVPQPWDMLPMKHPWHVALPKLDLWIVPQAQERYAFSFAF